MALNIKNPEVERLAAEVAAMMGESKTEAIRRALEERKRRLAFQIVSQDRSEKLRDYLERHVWPLVPEEMMGRAMTRQEEDKILGYDPEGV
jgi:antitoxin VapB